MTARNQARVRSMTGNTNPTFTGYTDKCEPKDQYNRPLHLVVHGHDIPTEVRERHDREIQARGEQVYYIKRKIEGDKCSCYDPETRMSRRYRCSLCYGTGIVSGYERYVSTNTAATDGRIWIAAPMSPKSLSLQEYGLDMLQNYSYWTLPRPVIASPDSVDTRSYDWIIRFKPDGVTEIGRYWITDSAISYWVENEEMHQAMNVKLADDDEILYSIDVQTLSTESGP